MVRMEEVPLLNRPLLEEMARGLPGAMVQKLLAQGLGAPTRAASGSKMALADSAKLAQEAHRLRGTAGTFGFSRISALAAEIEDRVGRGEDAAGLVVVLKDTVEATRGEVGQIGVDA